MKRMSNELYVMNAYLTAYKKGKVVKRYNKGSIKTKGGWIPNHIWNSGLTAGSDRRARKIRELYPQFFETIDRKSYMQIYYPSFDEKIISNWELNRIKPVMRPAWELMVYGQMKKKGMVK